MDDDDSVLEFDLVNDSYEIGRPRLDVNIKQVESSGFSMVLREKLAVHGQWGPGKEPASLLVYSVELHSKSRDKGRRFKHVDIKLRLENDPQTVPAEDP